MANPIGFSYVLKPNEAESLKAIQNFMKTAEKNALSLDLNLTKATSEFDKFIKKIQDTEIELKVRYKSVGTGQENSKPGGNKPPLDGFDDELERRIKLIQTRLSNALNNLVLKADSKGFQGLIPIEEITNQINRLGQTGESLKEIRLEASEIRAQLQLWGQGLNNVNSVLKGVNGLAGELESKVKSAAKEAANNKDLQDKVKSLEEQLKLQVEQIRLTKEYNTLTQEQKTTFNDLADSWKIQALSIEGATQQFDEFNDELREQQQLMNDRYIDRVNQGYEQLTGTVKSLAASYISLQAIFSQMQKHFQAAIQYTYDIDDAYTDVAISMDITRKEFNKWTEDAQKIARANGVATTSVMDMVKIYATAGEDIANISDKLAGTAMIQNITQFDAEKTTSIIGSAITQFKLMEKEIDGSVGNIANTINYFGDRLIAISNALEIDNIYGIQEMANAIDDAGAVVQTAGGTMEWFMGVTSTLAETMNATGSEVGAAIRMISARVLQQKQAFMEMNDTGEDVEYAMAGAEKALKQIGVTIRDNTSGDLKTLEQILGEVAVKWKDLDDSTKQFLGEKLAGNNRRSYFETLIENYQRVLDLQEIGLNSSGELMEANEVRVESLQGQIGQLQVSLEELYGTIVNENGMSTLIKSADGAVKVITVLAKVLKVTLLPALIPTIAAITAYQVALATSGKATIVSGLISNVKNIVTALKSMYAAIMASQAALLTFGAVIGGAALFGGFLAAISKINRDLEETRAQIEGVKDVATELDSTLENIDTIEDTVDQYKKANDELSTMLKGTEQYAKKQEEINGLKEQLMGYSPEYKALLEDETLELEKQYGVMKNMLDLDSRKGIQEAIDQLPDKNSGEEGSRAYQISKDVPDLEYIFNNLVEAKKENERLAKELANAPAEQTEEIAKALEESNENLYAHQKKFMDYLEPLKGSMDWVDNYNSILEKGKEVFADLGGRNPIELPEDAVNKYQEIISAYNELMELTGQVKEDTESMIDSINSINLDGLENKFKIEDYEIDSLGQLIKELGNVKDGSAEAETILSQLKGVFEDFPDNVETVSDAVEKLNKKFWEMKDAADLEKLNDNYITLAENMQKAQGFVNDLSGDLTPDLMRDIFDSGLLEGFNGQLTDTVAIADHLKVKIQEMEDAMYSATANMALANHEAWNDMTTKMAESLGTSVIDFQNFVNDINGLRQVDLKNCENATQAQGLMEAQLAMDGMNYYAQMMNSKALNRQTDMQNVVEFLNTQGAKEAKTVQELADMWAAFYKAKAEAINAEINEFNAKIGEMNRLGLNADTLEGFEDMIMGKNGVSKAAKHQAAKLQEQLSSLSNLNKNFTNYFAGIKDTFKGVTGGLAQSLASTEKLNNFIKNHGSGSGSKGNKGSGSKDKDKNKDKDSKKEVADLDLKIDKFREFEEAVNRASEALERNQQAQRMVNSKSELKSLLADEISLMEKKKESLGKLQAEYKKEQEYLKSRLEISGLIFNKEGEITGDRVTGGSVTDRLKDAEKWSNAASGKEKEWRINDTTNFQKTIDAYYDLMNQLGKVTSQYNDMAYEIRQTKKAHEELLKQVENLADRYLKIEMKVNAVDGELSLNRRKQEYAVGEDLLKLRERELVLLQEQRRLNTDRIHELQKEREELAKVVQEAGFVIGSDGSIVNYDQKWKEKTNEYNQLAGMAAADYKENLEKIADQIDRYLEITNGELPKAEEHYYDIDDALKEIAQQQEEWAKQLEDVNKLLDRLYDTTKKLSKAENELALIESKLAMAQGDDKIALLKRQEEIYHAQSKLLNEQYEIQKAQMKEMQSQLSRLGVAFDSDGYVSNYEALVKSMQEKIQAMPGGEARDRAIKELEELLAKIEEYDDLVRKEIPSTEQSWWDLNASIKEAQREQLQIMQDVQTSIANAIKNKWQENTQALQDEIDKQNEILNKQWKEEDWQDELGKAEMELNKLQAQIDNLSKDTSLAGQLKLEQLKEQYQEQLEAMNQMIKDHEREQTSQMLEDEKNKLEEDMKQALSAENLANLVNEALATGMVKIGEEAITLNDLMIQNITKQEDAYYALGEVMKSEMLANLQEAKSLYMDISKISGDLVTGNTTIATNAFGDILSKLKLTGSKSILENNNSPLVSIVMQGKTDESITLRDVEKVAKSQCDKLLVELNKIMG